MTSRDGDKRAGEVLSSLPSTRPQRRSARRDGGKPPAAKRAKPATKRAPAANKPAGAARPAARRKPPRAQPARPAGVRPSAATSRVRAGAGKAPRPGRDRPSERPQGAELVATGLQAAGELAQIGLSVGTRALRGVLSRVPRP